MSEQAASDGVVDMVQYLRDTISEMDSTIGEFQSKRHSLAIRLAALEAATDPEVLAVAEDLEARLAENHPYETAEPADNLIGEAYRRFGPQ